MKNENLLKFAAKVSSKLMTKERYMKIIFKNQVGYKLNLKNPTTLSEKLNWLKLYYFPKNELVVKCADKFLVREHIEKTIGAEYLNEIYGDWKDAREIDFDALPDSFVLKCTHGCHYNILVPDKNAIDIKKTVKQLNKWLKEDYGVFLSECHYDRKQGRIICEKFLESNITDYKFFCFNGKTDFMYLSEDALGNQRLAIVDNEGKLTPFQRIDREQIENPIIPDGFEKMKELSDQLAQDFPFVRVDWFEVDGKIYFSELTFTPVAGFIILAPREYDGILGEKLDISAYLTL